MHLPTFVFTALLGLGLGACNGTEEQGPLSECLDNFDCQGTQACLDGTCQVVDCLSDNDCPLDTLCSEEAGWVCGDGCTTSADCLAGKECTEDGVCAETSCESRDECGVGEFCTDGACDYLEGFCDLCDQADPDSCLDGFVCKHFDKENVDACVYSCDITLPEANSYCPTGSECVGSTNGEVCNAGCPDLIAAGFIGG